MKILLGMTGSVAMTIAPKIVAAMKEIGDVSVVTTETAERFYPYEFDGVKGYGDRDEWKNNFGLGPEWNKGDPVLHVDLAQEFDVLVIAPATMNTIAKMANGITDNLLSCVFAAWGKEKPVIIAPAMNTNMWNSRANQFNLKDLLYAGVRVVHPVEKMLACGVVGMGAMADIKDIVKEVALSLTETDGWRN
jgi:phosphopantothenoylcysteine decarboxylase